MANAVFVPGSTQSYRKHSTTQTYTLVAAAQQQKVPQQSDPKSATMMSAAAPPPATTICVDSAAAAVEAQTRCNPLYLKPVRTAATAAAVRDHPLTGIACTEHWIDADSNRKGLRSHGSMPWCKQLNGSIWLK